MTGAFGFLAYHVLQLREDVARLEQQVKLRKT